MGQKDFLFSILEDMAVSAQEKGVIAYSDFYEPGVQLMIEHEIGRYPGADCIFWGGQEYAERKMMAVLSKGTAHQNDAFPVECVQSAHIDSHITHRDVLGALMGLGIKREKIGDINVKDQFLQIFVSVPLGDFIQDNLSKINLYDVALEKVGANDCVSMEPQFTVMDIIVPSMRLDAVIHGAYKLSRSDASDYVKAQKVSINHFPVLKPSVNLKFGDIVSVRTKGRLIVDSALGTTHKGNIRLRIKKFS